MLWGERWSGTGSNRGLALVAFRIETSEFPVVEAQVG